MKVYGAPLSNNAFRLEFYLKEKGMSYDYVHVDLYKGEHKRPEYLALNPRGQVPTLVTNDGTAIYESVAIIQYIEFTMNEGSRLVPEHGQDRAICFTRILEFTEKLNPCNVLGSVLFGNQRRADLKDRIEKLLTEIAVWEKYLNGRDYFATTFSIVDIILFAFFAPVVEVLGLDMTEMPNVKSWYSRVKERPSCKSCRFWEGTKSWAQTMDYKVLQKSSI